MTQMTAQVYPDYPDDKMAKTHQSKSKGVTGTLIYSGEIGHLIIPPALAHYNYSNKITLAFLSV